jgi:uncharacterized protein (DUF736 family)
MNIGNFHQKDGVFVGTVQAVGGANLPVRIAPTDLKGIDYLVTLQSDKNVELGVGWNKVGEKKGTKYVSVKLDSPFLPAPAWCSLFTQPDGSYNLVWTRPDPAKRKPSEPAAPEQATA